VSDALTALLDRVADAASKATPGPWLLCKGHPSGEDETTHIEGSDRRVVAYTVLDGSDDARDYHNGALLALCDPELVSALVAVVREAIRCEAQTHSGEKPRAIGDCEGPPCKSLDALRALAESRARKEQP
jgi:hypothetical protein